MNRYLGSLEKGKHRKEQVKRIRCKKKCKVVTDIGAQCSFEFKVNLFERNEKMTSQAIYNVSRYHNMIIQLVSIVTDAHRRINSLRSGLPKNPWLIMLMKEFQRVFNFTVAQGPLQRIRTVLRRQLLPYLATKLLQNYNLYDVIQVLPFRLVCTSRIKFNVGDGRINEKSERSFYPRMLRVMEDFNMMHSSFSYLDDMLAKLRLHESVKTSKFGTKVYWTALMEEYNRIKAIKARVFNDEECDNASTRLLSLTKLRDMHAKEAEYMQQMVSQLLSTHKMTPIKFNAIQCLKRWKPAKYEDTTSDRCRKQFEAGLNQMLQLLQLPMARYDV